MQKQLITIGPGGDISGLQFKGKGVNLQSMGKAKTRRITDIEWQEEEQAWAVRFLQGSLVGTLMTPANYAQAMGDEKAEPPCPPFGTMHRPENPKAAFTLSSYDAAVALEIHTIQEATKKGNGPLLRDAD